MTTPNPNTLEGSPRQRRRFVDLNLWSIPTKPSFRNDIQGMRAIAVLYTVFFHFGVARWSTGVDIFMVISGFAITRVL